MLYRLFDEAYGYTESSTILSDNTDKSLVGPNGLRAQYHFTKTTMSKLLKLHVCYMCLLYYLK
jgi:hypothetical protein